MQCLGHPLVGQEQDISPQQISPCKVGSAKKRRSKRRRRESEPSIDLQSQQSGDPGSPINLHALPVDKTKSVAQIVEEFRLRPTYQTLEGHEGLSKEHMRLLMSYAVNLAKD